MTQSILYEFEGFLLDPTKRVLLQHGEPASLRPTAFNLLLTLVEQHGKTLSKSTLIESVWGSGSGDDRRLHVTLHEVRRKLGDTAKNSRFIVREPNGYRFVADVRQVITGHQLLLEADVNTVLNDELLKNPDVRVLEAIDAGATEEKIQIEKDVPLYIENITDGVAKSATELLLARKYFVHVLVSSLLYALLYAVAVILEVAYEWDRFRHAAMNFAPAAFMWILFTSAAALLLDQKLTRRRRRDAAVWSIGVFLISALIIYIVSLRFLPAASITKLNFQSYPAQAAYLKDIVYFILLGAFYIALPFHDVVRRNYHVADQAFPPSQKLSVGSSGNIFLTFWALTVLLVVLALASLVLSAHLLDNLRPGPYSNLFTQLVYLRSILYFGLGIECLFWYRHALHEVCGGVPQQ